MTPISSRTLSVLTATLTIISSVVASAGTSEVDADAAHHSAYKNGWTAGSDGSKNPAGFGGWVMGKGAEAPHIAIASSAGLGAGDNAIDGQKKSFKIHGQDGAIVDLYRFVDPHGLREGDTLTFDLAVNFRNGFKGVDARNEAGKVLFNFNIGADDYVVHQAASGNGSIGNEYASDTTFEIRFTQTGKDRGEWRVSRKGELKTKKSGTYMGVIRSLKFYCGEVEDGPENALYFNNLRLVSRK